MTRHVASPDPLTCRELVELVTDYLDGELPADERARFEAHLEGCGACIRYVEQIRETVRVAGSIREDDVPQALLDAFRGFR